MYLAQKLGYYFVSTLIGMPCIYYFLALLMYIYMTLPQRCLYYRVDDVFHGGKQPSMYYLVFTQSV